MAFFILSTSKIILMRFCTGLGSLDLVPGFTVNFFTASSSCRENQEETQLNNPSKAVVVSSGRERIECHQKVKKKKRLRVKGLALVARRKMLSMDRMRLPVRPRSSRLLPILIPDTAEASSSAQADLQAPALPPTLGLLVPSAHSCPTWKCWHLRGQTLEPRHTGLMDKFCLLSSLTLLHPRLNSHSLLCSAEVSSNQSHFLSRSLTVFKHIGASSLPLTPAPWDCSSWYTSNTGL